ncbi:MAG: hypothetical protein WCT14_17325 [Treponemataceae bacterium]
MKRQLRLLLTASLGAAVLFVSCQPTISPEPQTPPPHGKID